MNVHATSSYKVNWLGAALLQAMDTILSGRYTSPPARDLPTMVCGDELRQARADLREGGRQTEACSKISESKTAFLPSSVWAVP